MKAVVVRETGGAGMLTLEEVPAPGLRLRDVRIQVDSCGVCFHDVVTRNGTMKRGIELPFIPGHEVAGEVVEVGTEVTHFRVGDRVAAAQRRHVCGHCGLCRTGRETSCEEREFLGDAGLNGGYAEMVNVEEDNLAHVPDGVALEDAAIAACAIGTELNALRDVGRLRVGERVLITGAGGGLGLHGVQLARQGGAFVVAVTSSEEKAERIRAAGAHEVVITGRGADFSKEVRRVSDGGVDLCIDNVGSPTFQPTRRSFAMGGRWVFVGQLTGEFVQLNPAQLFFRNLSILSAKSTSREQLRDSLDLMRRGMVSATVVEQLPLTEAAAAHERMEAGHMVGRTVLKPAL